MSIGNVFSKCPLGALICDRVNVPLASVAWSCPVARTPVFTLRWCLLYTTRPSKWIVILQSLSQLRQRSHRILSAFGNRDMLLS